MKFLKRINGEADRVAEKVMTDVFRLDLNREFGYEDAVIIGLLENIINHVKTLEILDKKSHHTSIDVILRTIFENYVYLDFILESDTALRGKAYHYSTRLSEYELIDKLTEQTLSGRKLRELINTSLTDIQKIYEEKTDPEQRNKIEKEYINSIGMKRLRQKWYNLDGETNNFKKLCYKLKMEAEYEFIYSTLSKEVHGKDAINWFDLKEFVVSIKKSSAYKDNSLHIPMSTKFLIDSVKKVYKYYGMKDRLRHFEVMIGLHRRLR